MEGALLVIHCSFLCSSIRAVNTAEYPGVNPDCRLALALLSGHSRGSPVVNRPAQNYFYVPKISFYPVTPHSPTKTWAWLVLGGDDKQIKWN